MDLLSFLNLSVRNQACAMLPLKTPSCTLRTSKCNRPQLPGNQHQEIKPSAYNRECPSS